MGWGRGGIGNIEQQHHVVGETNKRASQDLEAQRAAAEDSASSTLSEQAATESRSTASQQYAYSGRGGAGNWYSPRELQTTGTFTSTESPTEGRLCSPTFASPESSSEAGYRGRGGAGNYVGSAEEQEAKAKEEEQREIELQELVRVDVESSLQRPDRAYLKHPAEIG